MASWCLLLTQRVPVVLRHDSSQGLRIVFAGFLPSYWSYLVTVLLQPLDCFMGIIEGDGPSVEEYSPLSVASKGDVVFFEHFLYRDVFFCVLLHICCIIVIKVNTSVLNEQLFFSQVDWRTLPFVAWLKKRTTMDLGEAP